MYLIVGIDAGINVGYAAINLDGRLVSAGVEKDKNHEELVKIISRVGIPSLVASDVAPVPYFVSKVAARFNVKVFNPKKSMTHVEKRKIGENIMNPHIRDAYAAAIKAYNNYANRLRQIDKLETKMDKIKLKHMIIQGHALANIIAPKQKTKISKTEKRSVKKALIKRKKKR